MTPRVKVCGVRRVEDARLAAALGARWIGVVRAADSPRQATLDEAAAVRGALSGGVRLVLVYRGESLPQVVREARRIGADAVQLHDASVHVESAARACGLVVLPVVACAAGAARVPEVPAATPDEPCVLDAGRGGSGRTLRWELFDGRAPPCTLVAGGITPDNVTALLRHRPFGIDVSSGVEHEPGVKDAGALRRLFAALEEVPA